MKVEVFVHELNKNVRLEVPSAKYERFMQKYGGMAIGRLVNMVAENDTLMEMGEEFHVTRERIRQWMILFGINKALGVRGRERMKKRSLDNRRWALEEKEREAKENLKPYEKLVLTRAKTRGLTTEVRFRNNGTKLVEKTFWINGVKCLVKPTHTVAKYYRWSTKYKKHPDAKFVLLVAERTIYVVPLKELEENEEVYIPVGRPSLDWDPYLENWGLFGTCKRKKQKAA